MIFLRNQPGNSRVGNELRNNKRKAIESSLKNKRFKQIPTAHFDEFFK